jgi:SSS family solute:Na+ symporter
LSPLDVIIVLGYFAGIFALAQWVSREKREHQKNAQDYFLAGRALPWWAIGASLIAANISADCAIKFPPCRSSCSCDSVRAFGP